MAHLGVDGVREVDGCRTGGQVDHVALRGEHEDPALVQVDLQSFHELARVCALLLPLQHLAQPGQFGLVVALLGSAVLVPPVGSDPVLGRAVHLMGPDLHLEGPALRAYNGGVKRLVHVELGHGDVILESPGDGPPLRMQRAERRVAVANRVDQDPDAHQVVDLVEFLPPQDHLLVHGIQVLGPPFYLGLDLHLPELPLEVGGHFLDVVLPLALPLLHESLDLVEPVRVQGPEGEVVELGLDALDAQPVRQRRVDL